MDFVVVLVVLTAVVGFVTTPLRRQRFASRPQAERIQEALRQVGDLEAAKEAKYREIRDADLDHGTGKLSDEDFAALDRSLRGEAIEILKALDRARDRLDAEADAVSDPVPAVEASPASPDGDAVERSSGDDDTPGTSDSARSAVRMKPTEVAETAE